MLSRHRISAFVLFVLLLITWEFVARMGIVSPQLLPSISDIGSAFAELWRDGYRDSTLFEHIGMSLYRVLSAFFLASIAGILLGILSGINPYIQSILTPIVDFLRPLPPLGYYFLLILWFGIDEESKIILLFFAAFSPIFIASYRGISRVKQDFIYSALSMGANKRQLFFSVLLPASLSDIFTGLRIAIGSCYATLVAAEMVAAQSGLGWLVLDASKFMQTDILFVGVILIGFLGISLDRILIYVKDKIIHWEAKI